MVFQALCHRGRLPEGAPNVKHLRGRPTLSGCAEYCLRVVGLLWAVLGVPGAPSGRVWPVGSGGVASRGCIHTSKIVSRKVHPSLQKISEIPWS